MRVDPPWPHEVTRDWAWGDATGRGVRVCVVDSGIELDHPRGRRGPALGARGLGRRGERRGRRLRRPERSRHGLRGHRALARARVRAGERPRAGRADDGHRQRPARGDRMGRRPGLRGHQPLALHPQGGLLPAGRPRLLRGQRDRRLRAQHDGRELPWRFSSVLSVASHEEADPQCSTTTPSRRSSIARDGRGHRLERRPADERGDGELLRHASHGGDVRADPRGAPGLDPLPLKSVLYLIADDVRPRTAERRGPGFRARVRESLAAFRDVGADRGMRRLQLAFAGSSTQWAASVPSRSTPSSGAARPPWSCRWWSAWCPPASRRPSSRRWPTADDRVRVMVTSDLARVALAGAMAASIDATAPLALIFGISTLNGIVGTAFEPAKSALMPRARGPQELTAANVVTTSIDSTSMFVGPALGGVWRPPPPGRLPVPGGGLCLVGRHAGRHPAGGAGRARGARGGRHARDAREGVGVVARDPALRLLFALIAAQLFVDGLLGVLVVVLALDLMDLGEAGVGYLNAALGVGGLLGVLVSASLVGARRLAPSFAVGNVIWGAPIALVALVPEPAFAAAMMGLVGIGNTFVDVSGVTLLQRAARRGGARPRVRAARGVRPRLAGPGRVGRADPDPLAGDQGGAGGGRRASFPPWRCCGGPRCAASTRTVRRSPSASSRSCAAIPIFSPLRGFAVEQLAARMATVELPGGSRGVRAGRRRGPLLRRRRRRGRGPRRRSGGPRRGTGRLVRGDRAAARRAADGHGAGAHGCGPARAGPRRVPGRGGGRPPAVRRPPTPS